MTLYMPPIARKKRVSGRYNPDSFRVISADAETTHRRFAPLSAKLESKSSLGLSLPDIYDRKTQVLPKAVPDYRINRPHPASCGFLRHNVRILNEPICSVFTSSTHNEQDQWWPSRTSKEPLEVPPKTSDTIYRNDFIDDVEKRPKGSARHTSNPNTEPALGTVPVNFLAARDGNKRFFKENISYEHQYDSRYENNYPIRAKRQGNFVWRQMSPETSKKFLEYQLKQDEAERAARRNIHSLDHQQPVSPTVTNGAPPPAKSPSRAGSGVVTSINDKPINPVGTQTPVTALNETVAGQADNSQNCDGLKRSVTFQSPVSAGKKEVPVL